MSLLECTKTVRHWRCEDYANAEMEAARNGLTACTMTPVKAKAGERA